MHAENEEQRRIESQKGVAYVRPWEKWGPYVSERQWGTVREDYSENGDAWNYFPFHHAHLRTYRWGEEGIAGFCDRYQVLVFAPSFWNGKDELIKERLFGLAETEGNHAEDVKELYYHLDAIPSHAYLKYLYKYPQNAFPYQQLREENEKRTVADPEYELLNTGIFDEQRYFDIVVEYAKVDEEDWVARIEAINRGPEAAPLVLMPQLWFRNSWSWDEHPLPKPSMQCIQEDAKGICLEADDREAPNPTTLIDDYHLGLRYFYGEPGAEVLFTENESNREMLWGVKADPYVKDAFHRYLIQGEQKAVNPAKKGSKAALLYRFPSVGPGKRVSVRIRLSHKQQQNPLALVDEVVEQRKKEADQFYESIHPKQATPEEKLIQRQAFAGMIWNKQFYYYEVSRWLKGDNPKAPPPEARWSGRNHRWGHIMTTALFSMPDKWEFPWFAAWDLSFQSLIFAKLDLEFAKEQLRLLLCDRFAHPNGTVPACEWEFGDLNPPIQASALLKLYGYDQDRDYLESCFHRLLLNFSAWINRVDHCGKNIFEGGFLGLDNTGFTDRSQHPPDVHLDQVDGVGWMSHFCLKLMRIALILAKKNPIYENLAIKFFFHFLYITASMRKGYGRSYDLWDEEDAFFYGAIIEADGSSTRLRVRSSANLIPFFAFDIWDEKELQEYPQFYYMYRWILKEKPHLVEKCIQQISIPGTTKHLFSVLNEKELGRMAQVLWDPAEFRSEHGLRSLSKWHEKNPAHFAGMTLGYEPAEADERIKGGNSNWRGPVWMPLNYLLIESLSQLGDVFGDRIRVEVEGENPVTLKQMAELYRARVLSLFKRNHQGLRPFLGENQLLQKDPHFRDLFYFPEYFHGDTGKGCGASHQCGWTALIANLISEI